MLILTSPAKTLDFKPDWQSEFTSVPFALEKSQKIINFLKKQNIKNLKKILNVSEKIAKENLERYVNWNPEHNSKTSKPAILAYAGDIFKQMFPKEYNKEQQEYAQNTILILSGLYGFVKAYDFIQPYRLEMSTKFKLGKTNDLYGFWKEDTTAEINKDIKEKNHKYLLNLASEEYYSIIDFKKVIVPTIIVEFRTNKGTQSNPQIKNVPFFSKKARGMVMEFMIRNRIEDLKGLQTFNTNGYKFFKEEKNRIWFIN